MSTAHAHHCPDCNAEISPDLRACDQCGADGGLWPESQRTPLILPGSPAFSADVVRKRTSIPTIVGGVTLGAAIIGAVLYYMPERQVEDPQAIALAPAPTPEPLSPASEPMTAVATVMPTPPATQAGSADSMPVFSYGDTALTRSVPSAASRRVVAASAPVRPPVVPPRSAPPPPAPASVAAVGLRTQATQPSTAPRSVTSTRTAPAATTANPTAVVSPSLTLTPILSNTLEPGERLQLRWSVTDRRTGRTLAGTPVEFTSTRQSIASVEPQTGLVVARAPGSVSIIVDGGRAGRATVRLTVSAPAPLAAVARPPAPVSSAVAAASASATTPPGTALRAEMPDADDVRTMVDRFIRDVRRDAVRNAELTQFMADGADHRVTLVSGPTIISTTTLGVRVTFDMRFTKFDSGGRPVTRVSSIEMDVDKRNGQPTSSAIAIGSLRRP